MTERTKNGAHQANALRKQALRLVSEALGVDASLFLQVYEFEGRRFLGDVMVEASDTTARILRRLDDSPAPRGSVGDPDLNAPWRVGYWGLTLPRTDHFNRFVELDRDIDREVFRATSMWCRIYDSAGFEGRMRALIYDETGFLGWVGGFRTNGSFTGHDRVAANRIVDDVRILLARARRLDLEIGFDAPTYAMARPDGTIVHSTARAASYLTSARRARLSRLIQSLRSDGFTRSPPVFWNGTQLRIVRLDSNGGEHFIVTLDRAVVPELSPLHVLTNRQRVVSSYAAVGCTYREIADHYEITPNTVKHHLKRAYDTLGIGSRAELAELWERWT